MTTYAGQMTPWFNGAQAVRQQITISGTVTEGERVLLLIDETKHEIADKTVSASDGSYSFTVYGSTLEKYSVVCLPDRFVSNENGGIKSKITGITE